MRVLLVEMRVLLAVLVLLLPSAAAAQVKETERLENCREVVAELATMKEGIPRSLLDKAECVAVIPSVKKFALGVGARFGKGAAVCRTDGGKGPWGRPLMIGISGGSFGAQIGGESADFVFLIMNPKGVEHLLKSKFTLGADASVAAGPVGRSAEAGTDLSMHAEILTYSRARGLFAGVSLEGAVVKQDKDANRRIYGESVAPKALLLDPGQRIPPAGKGLVSELTSLSPGGR